MITNLIKPRMRKLILNHLIGNDSPEFHNGLLGCYFFKLNLGSDCWNFLFLRSPFQNHLDLVISQKQRSLSNLSFKHNSANMPPLNLTSRLSFEPRFCMFLLTFTTYKKQTLVVLGLLVTLDSY